MSKFAFESESSRYVRSQINETDAYFLVHFDKLKSEPISSILDVGCGNGSNLQQLCMLFNCSGVGVEPSEDSTEILNRKYRNSNLNFLSESAASLSFSDDSFDLVVAWSILCWIDRNEYLQALGELIRVTKKYLVVMDFISDKNYKVPYSHNLNYFTYHADFEVPIISSGVMKKKIEYFWVRDSNEFPSRYIDVSDLTPFLGNKYSYHGRKMIIFEKDLNHLPTYFESDFQ